MFAIFVKFMYVSYLNSNIKVLLKELQRKTNKNGISLKSIIYTLQEFFLFNHVLTEIFINRKKLNMFVFTFGYNIFYILLRHTMLRFCFFGGSTDVRVIRQNCSADECVIWRNCSADVRVIRRNGSAK